MPEKKQTLKNEAGGQIGSEVSSKEARAKAEQAEFIANAKPLMGHGASKAMRILDLTAESDPEEVVKAVKAAVSMKK